MANRRKKHWTGTEHRTLCGKNEPTKRLTPHENKVTCWDCLELMYPDDPDGSFVREAWEDHYAKENFWDYE